MHRQKKHLISHINQYFYWICFTLSYSASATSYNQPVLPPSASWNTKAITFANRTLVGKEPYNVFVDRNNTIYIAARDLNSVLVWFENASSPSLTISRLKKPTSIFVTHNHAIYIGHDDNKVEQRLWNSIASPTVVLLTDKSCRGVYIDRNNSLYCSIVKSHLVLKRSLGSNTAPIVIVAGNRKAGSDSIRLNEPKGIFVANNFSLYVADFKNHRIQLFQPGSLNGITIVGGTVALSTMSLFEPIDVALDGNGYLFIVDSGNNRIVGSGPNGFRCIASCSGQSGSASHQLDDPRALSFDTYGNIYVADGLNNRIQKFTLIQSLPNGTMDVSYNQPILCPTASWNTEGITFANESIISKLPWDIFVDRKNTMYINAKTSNLIHVWFQGENTPRKSINHTLVDTLAIFTTDNGDIYVDGHRFNTSRIEKWTLNGTNGIPVMYTSDRCYSIFVDIYGNIYCSVGRKHQVIRRLHNESENITRVIAGFDNGTAGSTNESLYSPRSIFVTVSLNLYVADCDNSRVQLFRFGQRSATTIVGNDTIDLDCPTGIALDGDDYLFLSDYNNQRIIGSGPDGFRCIIGCDRINGSLSDQLSYPRSLRFDTDGNIFVADGFNNRIQKFMLEFKSCGISYARPQFCSSATWKSDGIPIINISNTALIPSSIFVNNKDYLYFNSRFNGGIRIRRTENTTFIQDIARLSGDETSLFITFNEDIYMQTDSSLNYRIIRWSTSNKTNETILSINTSCHGLFVDLKNQIYCSMGDKHQVIRKSLLDRTKSFTIVAGNGTAGLSSSLLSKPQGIFVTVDFVLYVADCKNNRIQYFLPNERNGTSVILNSLNGTIILSCPTGIFIDSDGNLFISDSLNHRIIGSASDVYRCIVGCTGTSGSATNQLSTPTSLTFDSYGNLYVADSDNHRILEFLLDDNICLSTLITIFIPPMCLGTTNIGVECDVINDACTVLNPCLNNGTCIETTNVPYGFICLCSKNTSGILCHIDDRLCQADTCRNDGICRVTSGTTYSCQCSANWTGDRCETKVDFCASSSCLNDGVCRSLVGGYRCECLGSSYSGRHCEKTSNGILIREILVKSFAYVAIICICAVAIFIIAMDVSKYFFKIDPMKKFIQKQTNKQSKSRRKKFIVLTRYTYTPGSWED